MNIENKTWDLVQIQRESLENMEKARYNDA